MKKYVPAAEAGVRVRLARCANINAERGHSLQHSADRQRTDEVGDRHEPGVCCIETLSGVYVGDLRATSLSTTLA